jgi:hypothetical protein
MFRLVPGRLGQRLRVPARIPRGRRVIQLRQNPRLRIARTPRPQRNGEPRQPLARELQPPTAHSRGRGLFPAMAVGASPEAAARMIRTRCTNLYCVVEARSDDSTVCCSTTLTTIEVLSLSVPSRKPTHPVGHHHTS